MYDYVSSTRIDYCKYILPYIKNLPEVLQNLSMSQVVEWILKDQKLKEYLGYDVYPSSDRALVKYHGNNQHLGTYWDYYNAIDNYILYTFQNTAWIEVNGEKKSPMEVLDAYTSRTNERYKNFLSVLTINDVEAVAKNLKINVEEVRQVLAYFSFPKYVTELSSGSFYGLMLALQETDVLTEDDLLLSRAIYRVIEQPDFNKDFEDSVNKKKFFEEGKLLVKYQGKLQYWPASEAILPSTRIINKKIFPIVEKGIRTNSKNFVRVFGCKEYSSDYEIIPNTAEVSNLNIDFQGYFLEFIKYAKAFSEKNDIIGSVINKLKVTLVNCISIKENGEVLSIDSNYTLLRKSVSDWYIVINVPSYDRNRMSECIENIFANIANTSGFDVSKIGELFRTNDLETRKFLIIKEFGSLDVINEDFGINHIEENFNKTLKALGKSVDEDFNIDFDEFASLENSANLVRFFRSINVELEAFSDAGFVYPIDLRRYWKRQLENVIRDNRTLFMSYLYNKSESDVLLQKNFVRILREFESFADQPIPNSVFFDPMSKLKVKFGDWTAHVPDGISVVDRYEANFAKMNPANLYQDEIGNDESAQVMIYFGAEEAFSKWLALQENKEAKELSDSEVIVLASGNLAMIYLTQWSKRLTYEEINSYFPELIPGIINNEYVGFILVRSREHGDLAIGKNGTYYLDSDKIDGENPLLGFGDNIVRHLKRTSSFEHTPDILVNSFYDEEADEVCAFEELVGSHGGAGGDQSKPFILYPSSWKVSDDDIIGAESIYKLLKENLAELKS